MACVKALAAGKGAHFSRTIRTLVLRVRIASEKCALFATGRWRTGIVGTWLLAGHSLGGVAAAEYAASHPNAFEGIVFLAAYPHTDLSGSGLAALSIVGSNDGIVRYGNYEGSRALLPENARERVIEGGNHAGFGDYGAQLGDMETTIASDEQQAISTDEIASLIDDLL